jgi:transcriptional regulator with XRE-family HTH domain
MVDMQAVGERVLVRRRRLGLTQQELADQAGCTRQQITLLETGKFPNITAQVAAGIAQVLGISTDELLGMDTEGLP